MIQPELWFYLHYYFVLHEGEKRKKKKKGEGKRGRIKVSSFTLKPNSEVGA